MALDVIVLAAGMGSRMHSPTAKVLHQVAGKTMLERVLLASRALQPQHLLVVYNDPALPQQITDPDLEWVQQQRRLGTGHAVQVALNQLSASHRTAELEPTSSNANLDLNLEDRQALILCADLPLLTAESLEEFYHACAMDYRLAVCTFWTSKPQGLGRIIRDSLDHFCAIVEEKDANLMQKQIREVNSGIILAQEQLLAQLLPRLQPHNQQHEYYLTDLVALAIAQGIAVCGFKSPQDERVFTGVNDTAQLAMAERYFQARQAHTLQQQFGLQLADPLRFDLRGELTVGKEVFIDADVILEGQVVLGDRVRIGPFCYLKDVTVEDDVTILAHSHLIGCHLAKQCNVGPFARLRPGSQIGPSAKIGNFVEIKNSQIQTAAKVNHLSYIGDTELGSYTNVGAGTITCNYDGQTKHRTLIGEHAFIGSNSALVAPVTIGDHATIGAGSIITKNVAAGSLAIGRAKQQEITGWQSKQLAQTK